MSMRHIAVIYIAVLIFLAAGCGNQKNTAVPVQKPGKPEIVEPAGPPATPLGEKPFVDLWRHVSPASAVLSWSCDDRENGARSYVEYGDTESLGLKTESTDTPRLNQFHRLSDLKTGTAYKVRLVSVDAAGEETRSEIFGIVPAMSAEYKILKPEDDKMLKISEAGYYVLETDAVFAAGGIEIRTSDVTLDLNGKTVTYSTGTNKRAHGILLNTRDTSNKNVKVVNGAVVQKNPEGKYTEKYGSYAVGAFGKAENLEMAGLTITVKQKCGRPIQIAHSVLNYEIHHNHCTSYVNTLVSRHWPGNAIIGANAGRGKTSIHHNLALNGPHRGIRVSGNEKAEADLQVYANDVETEQGYVNGYAINCCHNMKVYGNRVKSMSRGIHITATNIEVYDNYFELTQHQVYDDRPQGKTNWRHYYTVIHGIKLEKCGTGVRVYRNKVVGTQLLPDPDAPQRFTGAVTGTFEYMDENMKGDRDKWAPPTPLNFSAKPNAMTEVFENEFIGITLYKKANFRTDYGAQGEFATAIYVAGDLGPSDEGKYAVWMHDNVFKSNDTFIAGGNYRQTLKLENNKFILLEDPVENHQAFRGPKKMGELLKSGNNSFEGQTP